MALGQTAPPVPPSRRPWPLPEFHDTKFIVFTTIVWLFGELFTDLSVIYPQRVRKGRIQTEVEGGQLGEGAPKTQLKISAPKARENFWGFIRENSLVFLLNNALVYMFRRIQNESLKKDCIWVRIRGAFLAKKGAPKLNFHREGGAVAPICPPKSATGVGKP